MDNNIGLKRVIVYFRSLTFSDNTTTVYSNIRILHILNYNINSHLIKIFTSLEIILFEVLESIILLWPRFMPAMSAVSFPMLPDEQEDMVTRCQSWPVLSPLKQSYEPRGVLRCSSYV
jgi:hypothetical protein